MIAIDIKLEKKRGKKGFYNKLTKQHAELEVGFLGDDTYPNGKSVAKVAIFNEFGGGNTPPRPFMRTTVKRKKDRWVETVKDALNMGLSMKEALEMLGGFMKEDIKEAIRVWTNPPNAPSTIARKGFNNPLIETGRMMKSVRSKVK